MSSAQANMGWFEIRPLEGFGLLRFGLSPADVRQYGDIYGRITQDTTTETATTLPSDPDETINYFGGEVKIKAGERQPPTAQRITFENAMFLDFVDNQLSAMQIFNGSIPAYFGNQNIFQPTGAPMIRHIISTLQETPCFSGSELYFHEWAFVMSGFCYGAARDIEWQLSNERPKTLAIYLNREVARVPKSELARLPKLSLPPQ